MLQTLTRVFILTGIVFLATGVILFLGARLGLGKLPGDIVVRKGAVTFYFPVVTMIIISIVLTILFNIIRR